MKNHINITSIRVDELSRERKAELLAVLHKAVEEKFVLFNKEHTELIEELTACKRDKNGPILETVAKRVFLLAMDIEAARKNGDSAYYVLRVTDIGVIGVGDKRPYCGVKDDR